MRDNKRAQELADEGSTHSELVHGDSQIHKDCAKCRAIATEILTVMGMTPEAMLHLSDMHPEHPGSAIIKHLYGTEQTASLWD